MKTHSKRNRRSRYWAFVTLASATLLAACAAYGPYHANTAAEPLNSVRGPFDGRYKMAFIELEIKARLWMSHNALRPQRHP